MRSFQGVVAGLAVAGLAILIATSGCGGAKSSSSSGSPNPSPNPMPASISVSISPASATVAAGGTAQFSATVSGTSNTAVTWSVDGVAGGNSSVGTISASGLYTAPSAAGSHTVTATSAADTSKSASASVTVTAPHPVGTASVLTYHNDNARTGQNLNETTLLPATLSPAHFGKLFSYPVDGQIYAQPLYVSNLTVNGAAHNVVYVATEHDSVYAFDADGATTAPLWKTSFANPAQGVSSVPSCDVGFGTIQIVPELGITSTPVIDPVSQTIYVVAESKENGVYMHKLHALDLTTGGEKFGGPVVIQGSVPGSSPFDSDGAGHLVFAPGKTSLLHLQRSALLLANGTVYIGFASHLDQNPYHGWLFAYNAATLAQVAVFNTTPNGTGAQGGKGALWASGGGPASDALGNLYAFIGNGTFDAASGGTDYGDTAIKWTPTLNVVDWFAPFNEAQLEQQDLDLGSSGAVVLPDQATSPTHLLVGGSKAGGIYLLNRDNLGHFNPAGDTQIVQSLPNAVGATFSTPAYWNQQVYFVAVGDFPKAFTLSGSHLSTSPSSQASHRFGFTGATPSISANQNTGGIVWTLENSGFARPNSCSDSTSVGAPAILHAYDATNLAHELYNSGLQAGDNAGPAIKFTVPTVANGHVYVGGQNQLTVYGAR